MNFKFNFFLLKDLPSAFFSGVKLKHIDDNSCSVRIRHSWFNKNPFKSIFWAAQGMAAEMTTALLLKEKIRKTGYDISMLVIKNESIFYKKAKGKIIFSCDDGEIINEMIEDLVTANKSKTILLSSSGIDLENDIVSEFKFKWSLKIRNS